MFGLKNKFTDCLLIRFLFYITFFVFLTTFDAGAKGMFGAGEFYLNNGMRVLVIPNHRVPIVKHMLWYKTGAADEEIGKGGIAHLLEHLMFRGTKKVSADKFNQLMEENGAESNAFTGMEVTAYHQLSDVSRLELAMALEADRMNNLNIDDIAFIRERGIVFEERKQLIDNNPIARFREKINKVLWQEHPFGRPVTGTDEEILKLTKADAEKFYNDFYAPNNAVLVICGDIDIKTARVLAEKYYANLPIKNIKETKLPNLKNGFRAKIVLSDAEVRSMRIIKVYTAPSLAKNKDAVYPLQILAHYMGGGESSKLYKKLVLEDKKALAVSVDYDPVSKDYGVFQVSMVPVGGLDADEAIKILENAWDEAIKELDTDEVEKIKHKLLAGLVYLRDNPEDAAYIVGAMACAGAGLDDIENQEQLLRQVRKKQVIDALKSLEQSASQVVGVLLPEDENNG